MAETSNYNLYKTSDSSTTFQEWREKIAGDTDSNMDKIDAALNAHDIAIEGKQDKLTGEPGKIVGFDENGHMVAQENGPGKNSVAVNGGGEITLPVSFGDGPYTFEMTEETDSDDLPTSGVTSFNGRTGAISPQEGDYTAAMVGARPDTWVPTANDVGAATPDDVIALVENKVSSISVSTIAMVTEAEYEAIQTKDPTTLYLIPGV